MSELSISKASLRMNMIVSHMVKHLCRPDLSVRNEDRVFNDSISELQSLEDHIVEYYRNVSNLKDSLQTVVSCLSSLSECAGKFTKAEEDGSQAQFYHQSLAPYFANIKEQLDSVYENSYMSPIVSQLAEFQQIKLKADERVALILDRRHYEAKVKVLEAKLSGGNNFTQQEYNDAFSRPSEMDSSYIRPSQDLSNFPPPSGLKGMVQAQQEKLNSTKLARNTTKLQQVNSTLQSGSEKLCSDLDQVDTFRKTIIFSQVPSVMTYSVELLESLTAVMRGLDLTIQEVTPTVTSSESYLTKYRKSVHFRHSTEGVALGESYTPDPSSDTTPQPPITSKSSTSTSILTRASNAMSDISSSIRKANSPQPSIQPTSRPPPPPPAITTTSSRQMPPKVSKEDDVDSVDSWEGSQAVNIMKPPNALMSELGANLNTRRKSAATDTLPPNISNNNQILAPTSIPPPPIPNKFKSSEQDANNYSKPTPPPIMARRRPSDPTMNTPPQPPIIPKRSTDDISSNNSNNNFPPKPPSTRISIKIGNDIVELPNVPMRKAPMPPNHPSARLSSAVAVEVEEEVNPPPIPIIPTSFGGKPGLRPPPRPDSVEAGLASSSNRSSADANPQKRSMTLSQLLRAQAEMPVIQGDDDDIGGNEDDVYEEDLQRQDVGVSRNFL